MIEIKSWDGRVLYTAQTATEVRTAVTEAVRSRADLSRADLSRADLSGADLSGADLSGADLSGAKGVNPLLTTPLHMLLDQPGAIRAYKLVTAEGKGPHYPSLTYEIGQTVTAEADTDPNRDCAPGINVATLDWVLREYVDGYRILVVEFTAADIACIPTGSDGKFRCHKVTVVGEKTLAEVGLAPVAEQVAS